MNRNDRYAVRLGDAPPPVEYRSRDSEKRFTSTFLIILVSLLFVAVFGGALVGGVVSGDPSNRFFITIIAASGGAIGVAIIVSLRYVCLQRSAHKHREYAMKDPETRHVQQTFTRSVDEDEEVGYFDDRGRFYQGQGPVEENIREVKARAMTPGDVSAMSLASYDMESYTQATSHFTRGYNGNGYRLRINERPKEEYHDGPFDFSSVTSSKQNFPVREDPPEDGAGCNLYCGMPMSKDPSAAIATADGNILNEEDSDVDLNSPDAKSLSSRSAMSRYDVPDEELVVQDQEMDAFDVRSDIADDDRKEASKSQGKGSKRKDNNIPPPPPPPPPPSRSRSGRSTPTSKAGSSTAAASEAGSAVSSLFLKPFANMFGKKKTTLEAGYSDAGTHVKDSQVGINSTESQSKAKSTDSGKRPIGKEGKPPMPGKKNSEEKRRALDTIGNGLNDDRYAPSTPGKNSTFSIPPPRRVPSTPGSEAPSEFRSMAGSSVFSNGVASSTFDPGAHERAIRRTQKNTAALGATLNDMPIFYEEDESAVNSVAPSETTARSIGYDVFAPPGPLGMVVDTVEKGCIVHSLKKTSPMQGLINPGDLIVALDDFDVRKMDAASLTKLMAQKSQQKERKFTLIPADQY